MSDNELILGWAAGNLKSLMDQLRSGELDNSDEFWTPSLNRWLFGASDEMSVSVQTLRGIQYAPESEYMEFWKKHCLPVIE